MKKFIAQLSLFIIPVFLLISLPTYILWYSKENFYHVENALFNKKKFIIGYVYNENNYGFVKWTNLNSSKKYKVWALGSSRVLQFRSNMFDSSFYNAGYSIAKINEFVPFLKSIPNDKYPDYLIIGLDQWMFNSSWDPIDKAPASAFWQESFTLFPNITVYKNTINNFLSGKVKISSLRKSGSIDKVGLNAIINNTGFINDGSFFYGRQVDKLINKDTTAIDYLYSDTYNRILHGDRRFEYGKTVNKKALTELNVLLDYCKSNKIEVVAFLPPFADKVYAKMQESNNYGYLSEIYFKVKPIFDKYNYEVYDFSKVSLCESNDFETIDGFHGSEVTYQRLLIEILKRGSALNKFTAIKRLENDLKYRKNNYIVYDN